VVHRLTVIEAMAEDGWPGFSSYGPSSLGKPEDSFGVAVHVFVENEAKVVVKLLLPGVFDLGHASVSALLNRG
jgi:hypothetical protein